MDHQTPESRATHRRETRNQIYLPILSAVLLVLVGVAVALLFQRRVQISLVADWMLTAVVLLPLLVCAFVIHIALIVAILGVSRLHNQVVASLQRAGQVTRSLNERSARTTDRANRGVIRVGAWFGSLDRIFGVFDRPDATDGKTSDE